MINEKVVENHEMAENLAILRKKCAFLDFFLIYDRNKRIKIKL
jgi:hypothetical protein